MKLRGNWEIDRAPTKKERVATIVISLILCVFLGFFSLFGVLSYWEGKSKLVDFTFFYILFFLAIWSLVRALFTQPKKPSATAILALGAFFVIVGLFLLVMPSSSAFSSYYIFTGIFGGISLAAQGYIKMQKP